MGELIEVDTAALQACAGRMVSLAQHLESGVATVASRMAHLPALSGSVTAAAVQPLADLARSVGTEASRDLRGLAGGLRLAAVAYDRTEQLSAQAAADLGRAVAKTQDGGGSGGEVPVL